MDEKYEAAVKAGDIHGAILLAKDISGKFTYAKRFGKRTNIYGSEIPLELDAILYLASCTKIVTSIAAMQCVEAGKLALHDDLAKISPELDALEILSTEGDPFSTKKKSRPITLEHLLTHSSGCVYDIMEPDFIKWLESRGIKPGRGSTLEERYGKALKFEPGTAWQYGTSIDWTGRVIEKVTGQTLEEYFKQHILQPLGLKDVTFWPMQQSALRDRMVDCNPSDPKGLGLAICSGVDMFDGADFCMGGGGLYGPGTEYIEILHSLLVNDGRLLKKETVDDMFKPHLSEQARQSMMQILGTDIGSSYFGSGFDKTTLRDWGLGGVLVQEDIPDFMQSGTMAWGGGINSVWFVDRKTGICAFAAPQVPLPVDHNKLSVLKDAFRHDVYRAFAEWKSKGEL